MGTVLVSAVTARARHDGIGAVLFDALALFDARPVAFTAEEVFPGHGAELMAAWRTRQFEYTWLRVVAGTYADFWQCTDDSLRYSAAALGLALTLERRERLLRAHLELRPWPDVAPALSALRSAGLRLGVLSNFTRTMLDASIRHAGLFGAFEQVLSTDRARTFKPDPRAYQLGVDAMRLPRERIAFAAFAGWDAAGATQFGYPTFWINRLRAPAEELGAPPPDGSGSTATDLVAFVRATSNR